MKTKIVLGMLCALGVAYGAVNTKEIEKTLQAHSLQGSVVSSSELASGLSMVVVSVNGQEAPFLATDDGKLIFQPEVLLAQDKSVEPRVQAFYKEIFDKQKTKTNTALKDVFKKQDVNVFHLKSAKNTTKTIYIVSDANCPYCQKEFARLSERLEGANVELLLVGFLGEDSMQKAAYALKNKSGNQAQDIAMLTKLYQPKSKIQPTDTKVAKDITQAVSETGVRGVPYIIEE